MSSSKSNSDKMCSFGSPITLNLQWTFGLSFQMVCLVYLEVTLMVTYPSSLLRILHTKYKGNLSMDENLNALTTSVHSIGNLLILLRVGVY